MITAKMRITIGLTCLSASVLLVAVFIGMIPDRRGAVFDGRRKLCEAIAVNSSVLVSTQDVARLAAVLQAVVERNDDILSAGVRRPDGRLEIEVGPHQTLWKDMTTDESVLEQLQVPLRAGKTKWGMVELRFQSTGKTGWMGMVTSPIVLLATFCSCGSFIVFMIYLGKMLQHLDPSQAVPRRVRSALDTLAEGLLVIDKDERIVLANQALGSWVECDPSKLLGRKISELHWVSETGESLEEYPWSRSVRDGCQLAGFVMGIKKGPEGDVRSLMVNATPVLGQDGKYRGVLISLDDVTQLETTKKELQISKVAAEDANRAKSDFLARMSHEIRTPMNAILGYTDVLRQGYDETVTDRQEYLDTIHTSGQHLLSLINDILDLSKIEAGHLELELQPVAPYSLFAHVVQVFRARANEKGIQLDFECDGAIPATIQTDSVRLRQTVMNLVGNAIKFTNQGGVRVVSRITDDNGKPQLAIDVIDTGIGISEAAIKSIFDSFSQADTSITRRFGGTGLGLAISLQLAEALGGGVAVKSTAGQGSTFTATVDTGSLDGIALLSAVEAKAASEQRAEQSRAVRMLPPGKVLVADDGDANRKLLKLVLGRAGMTVVAVEDGKQAVEAARAQEFHIILMDMQMPVMDGYTATNTMRADGCRLPIIALTANVMQSDEAKCREAGCSGFVPKPIDMDVLFAVIAEQMGGVKVTAEPPATRVDIDQFPSEMAVEPQRTNSVKTTDEAAEIEQVFGEVLRAMQASLKKEDFPKLASLANSLNEAASVFSLNEYIIGTARLELAARHGEADDCRDILAQLTGSQSDQDPQPDTEPTPREVASSSEKILAEPLCSTLPMDDAEFREVVGIFVERLKDRVDAMLACWEQRDFETLGATPIG